VKWGAGVPGGYSRDDEFDYEEFVRREFGSADRRVLGMPVWLFVMVLVAALLAMLVLVAAL